MPTRLELPNTRRMRLRNSRRPCHVLSTGHRDLEDALTVDVVPRGRVRCNSRESRPRRRVPPLSGTIRACEGFAHMRKHGDDRMHWTRAAAAAAGLIALTWAHGASAQSFGIYVGPPAVYDYDEGYAYGPAYGPGPRVYGYTRRQNDGEYDTRRAGGCGVYRYWNGDRCVDARNR